MNTDQYEYIREAKELVVEDDYFLLTKVPARKNNSTKKDIREFGRIKARGRK